MCIADMAAGRRTKVIKYAAAGTAASPVVLPANPYRLRLVVAGIEEQFRYTVGISASQSDAFFVGFNGTTNTPNVLRVEDYGLLLLGQLWVQTSSFTPTVINAWSIEADAGLDMLIQREAR